MREPDGLFGSNANRTPDTCDIDNNSRVSDQDDRFCERKCDVCYHNVCVLEHLNRCEGDNMMRRGVTNAAIRVGSPHLGKASLELRVLAD